MKRVFFYLLGTALVAFGVIFAVTDIATLHKAKSLGVNLFLLVVFLALVWAGIVLFRKARGVDQTTVTAFRVFAEGRLNVSEAQRMQEEFMRRYPTTDPISQKINAAARLMTAQRFQEAIEMYLAIAREPPERAADCESQIGAACFFLGDYTRHQSLSAGQDAGRRHSHDG